MQLDTQFQVSSHQRIEAALAHKSSAALLNSPIDFSCIYLRKPKTEWELPNFTPSDQIEVREKVLLPPIESALISLAKQITAIIAHEKREALAVYNRLKGLHGNTLKEFMEMHLEHETATAQLLQRVSQVKQDTQTGIHFRKSTTTIDQLDQSIREIASRYAISSIETFPRYQELLGLVAFFSTKSSLCRRGFLKKIPDGTISSNIETSGQERSAIVLRYIFKHAEKLRPSKERLGLLLT